MEIDSASAYPSASYAAVRSAGNSEPVREPERAQYVEEPPPAAAEVVPYPDYMGRYVNLLV